VPRSGRSNFAFRGLRVERVEPFPPQEEGVKISPLGCGNQNFFMTCPSPIHFFNDQLLKISSHKSKVGARKARYPPITYYWTVPLILDHSYLVGNLTNAKFGETKAYRTSKILTLLYQQFSNLLISKRDMSGPRLRTQSDNRWSGRSWPVLDSHL
jgi:hypothetical protein